MLQAIICTQQFQTVNHGLKVTHKLAPEDFGVYSFMVVLMLKWHIWMVLAQFPDQNSMTGCCRTSKTSETKIISVSTSTFQLLIVVVKIILPQYSKLTMNYAINKNL